MCAPSATRKAVEASTTTVFDPGSRSATASTAASSYGCAGGGCVCRVAGRERGVGAFGGGLPGRRRQCGAKEGGRAGRQRMTALEVLRYSLRAAGSCGAARARVAGGRRGGVRAGGGQEAPAAQGAGAPLGFPAGPGAAARAPVARLPEVVWDGDDLQVRALREAVPNLWGNNKREHICLRRASGVCGAQAAAPQRAAGQCVFGRCSSSFDGGRGTSSFAAE